MKEENPNAEVEANLLQGKNLYTSAGTTLQQIKHDLDGLAASLQAAWIGDAYDAYMQKQDQLAKAVQAGGDVLQKGSIEIGKMYDAYMEADEKQREMKKLAETEELFMDVFIIITTIFVVIAPMLAAADVAFEVGMEAIDVAVDVGEVATEVGEVATEVSEVAMEVDEVATEVGEVGTNSIEVIEDLPPLEISEESPSEIAVEEPPSEIAVEEPPSEIAVEEQPIPETPGGSKGKGVDKGKGRPEPNDDPKGPGTSTQNSTTSNSDGSVTTIENKVTPGYRGKTTTIRRTTSYSDGSTEMTEHFYDVNDKPVGSTIKTIEGNETRVTNYDVDGQPTHQSITTTEGNTTTTSQYDGQGKPIGKSVEVKQGDTAISTDYNAQNEVSYQQELTDIRDADGNIIGQKQVITERNYDGSITRTTEVFDIDKGGGRYLESSHTETIPNSDTGPSNPNSPIDPPSQPGGSSPKRQFKNPFRKK